jgi:hypothetical protein
MDGRDLLLSSAALMNDLSHKRRADALALGLALTLAFAYAMPALMAVYHGEVRSLRVEHSETLSLTTYGRWWILAPHHFMTDAFSGDLATFYNFLSDALLNAGGTLTGLSPMAFQALVYAPFLGFLMIWGGYQALAGVVADRMTAALAAGIAAFTVDPSLSRLVLDHATHDHLTLLLHVPFHAVALGNGQSLGWTLFLPATALLFRAREDFTPRRGIAHGLLFGLMFLVHTLTFMNVAFVAAAYLTVRRLLERPFGRRHQVWAAGMVVILAVFAWFAWIRPPQTFLVLAALWVLTMAWLFLTDTDPRFYLWSFLPAAVVAFPYALHLARNARYLPGRDGTMGHVPAFHILLFFVLQWMLVAAAWRWAPRTTALRWATVMLAANLFLAANHLWAWGNHPYRFAINLVFPLGVIAAIGLRHAPRAVAWTLGLGLIAAALPPTVGAARNDRLFARITTGSVGTQPFLDTIRTVTDAEPDRNARLLTPPEFHYPDGVVQSATILNFSSLPGFVADYRYVLWSERHLNRLQLFCFLFPSYPHYDAHTQLRACEHSGAPVLFDIVDRRIDTAVLPVYGIRYGAAVGFPFSGPLADAAQVNGWPLLAHDGTYRFHRVGAAVLPGVARAERGTYSRSGFTVTVEISDPGLQRIVIGGRVLHDRAPRLVVDGHEVSPGARSNSWLVANVELSAGRHLLELPRECAHWQDESDFVYFLAVVQEQEAGRYFKDRSAAPAAPRS